jgi:TadE-like protein
VANLRVRLLHRRLSSAELPRKRSAGQSLVEFALVFPLFFVLVLSVIEFAFAFNAILAVNYASRDAALTAAEAGSGSGSDCVILSGIEKDIGPPANHANVSRVDIYRAKSDGSAYASDASWTTTYLRSGSTPCTLPDGTSLSVPYTTTSATNKYPEASRCNLLAGCTGTGNHTTIDHIGVRVFYNHAYVTPLRTFVGTGSSFSFDRSNVMRMEPVQ